MCKFLSLPLFLYILISCVSTQPNQEYALAQSALSVAKKFEADKLAPNTYVKALYFYKKAISLYEQRDYDDARNSFDKSIDLAEKAELKARVRSFRELSY